MSTSSNTAADNASRTGMALGTSVLAVIVFVVAMLVAGDDNDPQEWLWPVAGVLGLIGAVLGWRAQRPPKGRALTAVILGGLVFLVILGWTVVALIAGDM
jgi:peptidoglycan/LPS O-acetylase OafA/YrhL